MLDTAVGVTCQSLQNAEDAKHKCIVRVHLVGATCIRERLGIAIPLSAIHDVHRAQRVAMRIRAVEFNGARDRPRGFPKGVLPIRRHLIEESAP